MKEDMSKTWLRLSLAVSAPILALTVGVAALRAEVPHPPSSGQTISAKEMKENLDYLESLTVPAGSVLFWSCPKEGGCTVADIPQSFWVCDGTQINKEGSKLHLQKAPNLMGAFAMGVPLEENKQAGGSNTIELSHSHTYDVSHDHPSFGTSNAGDHNHALPFGAQNTTFWANEDNDHLSTFGSVVVSGPGMAVNFPSDAQVNGVQRQAFSSSNGAHTHQADPPGYTEAPRTTSTAGAQVDSRPKYIGLLPLIKL